MTEALTKQPTLAELKVAARVLLEEDPSLVAAQFSLRHQETIRLIDEAILQAKAGTATYLNHLIARCRLDTEYIQTLQALGILPHSLGAAVREEYHFKATVGLIDLQSGRRDINMFKTIDAVE
jgi:hypothetical protein